MIPKIIHYCWFGPKAMDERYRLYIDGWKKIMPDYDIKLWTEDNTPRNPYVTRALNNGMYSNVSNFMRLVALRNYGGVYLDTDMEVIKRFDHLLGNTAFAGEQSPGDVNSAILGSVAGGAFITRAAAELPRLFDGLEPSWISGPDFTTVMLKGGDRGVTIYPTDWFYPYPYLGEFKPECITKNTVCIHHWAKRW